MCAGPDYQLTAGLHQTHCADPLRTPRAPLSTPRLNQRLRDPDHLTDRLRVVRPRLLRHRRVVTGEFPRPIAPRRALHIDPTSVHTT